MQLLTISQYIKAKNYDAIKKKVFIPSGYKRKSVIKKEIQYPSCVTTRRQLNDQSEFLQIVYAIKNFCQW